MTWDPGERVDVRLPMPWYAVLLYILGGVGCVGAFMAATGGMSSRQIESGIWVPGMLLSMAGGFFGGWAIARQLFGSSLHLDWSTRIATVTGRGARAFAFADITEVATAITQHRGRHSSYLACEIVLLTPTERLVVRHHTGHPQDRKRLEKLLTKEARQLARALRLKFRPTPA